MRKNSPILEFIILGIVGTLCHFVYKWTGENSFVALFVPINESTWEHLKLLFFPSIIYFTIEYILWKKRPENFIAASTIGIILGKLTIVTFYYTYSGVLGFTVPFLNVFSFFIGLFVMIFTKALILRNKKFCSKASKYLSIYYIMRTALLFFWFTFHPLQFGIFISP